MRCPRRFCDERFLEISFLGPFGTSVMVSSIASPACLSVCSGAILRERTPSFVHWIYIRLIKRTKRIRSHRDTLHSYNVFIASFDRSALIININFILTIKKIGKKIKLRKRLVWNLKGSWDNKLMLLCHFYVYHLSLKAKSNTLQK